jgi:hypothetical protein
MANISETWEDRLQSARPSLITRVEFLDTDVRTARLIPLIRMTDPGWDALIDEGYDPKGPLGPTYWRIVKRDPELLYLSTAPIPRESVFKGWGYEGLAYCDLLTGIGIVRLETFLKLAETQKH